MSMRILHIILITSFLAGTAALAKDASSAKVQSQQSNWTKIKEIFK